jgi:hypothetical protein
MCDRLAIQLTNMLRRLEYHHPWSLPAPSEIISTQKDVKDLRETARQGTVIPSRIVQLSSPAHSNHHLNFYTW